MRTWYNMSAVAMLALLCACSTVAPVGPPAQASGGDTWTRPADGATMVYVPAGEFPYGPGSSEDVPDRRVYLDAYWIDRTEVTNAQYACCVADGVCLEPIYTVPYEDPARADHPVVAISHGEAETFCAWAGGRLPREIEWEKAARGTDGRIYPWGDAFEPQWVNHYWTAIGGTQPVGSYPEGASPYGALDMSGNVSEWVQERWRTLEEYLENPLSTHYGGPHPVGAHFTLRGGGWPDLETSLRTYFRTNEEPTWRTKDMGFRCVISQAVTATSAPAGPWPDGTPEVQR